MSRIFNIKTTLGAGALFGLGSVLAFHPDISRNPILNPLSLFGLTFVLVVGLLSIIRSSLAYRTLLASNDEAQISRLAELIVPIGICFGIDQLATLIAHNIFDTAFFAFKLIDSVSWNYFVDRQIHGPIAIYDVLKSIFGLSLVIAAMVVISRSSGFRLLSLFRFGQFRWIFVILVVAIPFATLLTVAFLYAAFGVNFGILNSENWLVFSRPFAFWALIFGILVPLQEELVFRGYLVTMLERQGYRAWQVLWIVSLVFALAHISFDIGLLRPIGILPGALIWTWMRQKSGGMVWPFLSHMSLNIVNQIPAVNNFFSHLF
jgi:membrane protease YdiL (CAAX protease family)